MYKIERLPKFDKRYKKLVKKNFEIGDKVRKAVKLLMNDPKYPSLKSHQVNHPEYGKIWSSWVHDDLRVLWKYEGEKIVILLLDIDDHDHIY